MDRDKNLDSLEVDLVSRRKIVLGAAEDERTVRYKRNASLEDQQTTAVLERVETLKITSTTATSLIFDGAFSVRDFAKTKIFNKISQERFDGDQGAAAPATILDVVDHQELGEIMDRLCKNYERFTVTGKPSGETADLLQPDGYDSSSSEDSWREQLEQIKINEEEMRAAASEQQKEEDLDYAEFKKGLN